MTQQIRKTAPKFMNIPMLHALIEDVDDYAIRIHIAAKWYAENGFYIVPFFKFGFPDGLSQHHASISSDTIDSWWHPVTGRFPSASIAMAHGGESGFCAIDLDTKDADGIQALADLVAMYGEYTDTGADDLTTLMATTPSGGRHLIYQFHPEIISNSEAAVAGIDTRGGLKLNPIQNGGITFLEPSMKPDGSGTYRWDDTILDIAQIPQWLVDVLNNRQPAMGSGIKLQDAYIESAAGNHGDGRDRNIYMDLMRFAGIGYTEDQLLSLKPDILARMDPPDPVMVDRKIASVIESQAFQNYKSEKKSSTDIAALGLIQTEKGATLKCVENLETILSSPLFQYEYGHIQYDDFTHAMVRNGEPMASIVDWSIGIRLWVATKFKIDYPKQDVRDAVENLAYSSPHINIARDYMLSCPPPIADDRDLDYFGSGRKGPSTAFYRLCNEVLDLSNPSLHIGYSKFHQTNYTAFLWFWMQGVAARACVPACKMEIMLNIFGGQGIGKSLFFASVCPDSSWFSDSIQDSIVGSGDNRDELMKLHAKIIIEMPELSPIKRGGKSADDKLKQFISSRVDNMRRPYGRDTVSHARTCALAGTSNNRDVYRDSTGNRRFVSIDHGTTPINLGDRTNGVMDEIRDAMWGELVSSFNDGELDLHPDALFVSIPPALRDAQAIINGTHKFEEFGVEEILIWMGHITRVTWAEVITHAKTVAGLRDAKESVIMATVRKELANNPAFEFKKRATLWTEDNKKIKTNCWVNLSHPLESDYSADGTSTVPRHWTTYINGGPDDTNAEF